MLTSSSLRAHLLFGWGALLLVFGGLALWSVYAPFEGAVLASGQVSVASNQQAIQHLEGGIVAEIKVREADSVNAGQVLISLDGTVVDASLQRLEARLFELLGAEARLTSERDGSPELSVRSQFSELQDLPSIALVIEAQSTLRNSRALTRSTQRTIIEQRIEQLSNRIAGMEREILSKDQQTTLLEDEISRFQSLVDKGNASVVRVLDLKRQLARVTGEKDSLVSEISTTRIRIGEARSELLKLEQDFRESILSELRDVQTQIEELSEERVALLDRQSRLDIVSPMNGRVIGVRAHTVGGVISASDTIMYVVPAGDKLVAKAKVSLADIDQISANQTAFLRFPAFDQNKTPKMAGIVTKVSADALVDATTGLPYYDVVVEFSAEKLEGQGIKLIPGMPVEVAIRTKRRTVLSYLVKPLTDAMSRTFRES